MRTHPASRGPQALQAGQREDSRGYAGHPVQAAVWTKRGRDRARRRRPLFSWLAGIGCPDRPAERAGRSVVSLAS